MPATIFHVKDPESAAGFYHDKLGFDITLNGGIPLNMW